jgi:hypothetical protein
MIAEKLEAESRQLPNCSTWNNFAWKVDLKTEHRVASPGDKVEDTKLKSKSAVPPAGATGRSALSEFVVILNLQKRTGQKRETALAGF